MKLITTIMATSLLVSSVGWAAEHETHTYEVKVTNITKGVSFTPLLAATHAPGIAFFSTGLRASDALADLAEGGDTAPLEMWLLDRPEKVMDTTTTGGLLGPGETVVFTIEGSDFFNRFSMAGMLLPTNDTFVAINSMRLPKSMTGRFANAYDAGSEENDELCASIPGPTCGGEPFSEGQAEGYVYFGTGIHGNADLSSDDYDWRQFVARIFVKRMD